MEWKEVVEMLFQAVVVGCAPAVVLMIRSYIKVKTDHLVQKMENERVARLVQQASDMVGQIVEETTQTYVDNMKKESVFDQEAQKIAFDKSWRKAKELMYLDMRNAVEQTYTSFDKWLETQIESNIAKAHMGITVGTECVLEDLDR